MVVRQIKDDSSESALSVGSAATLQANGFRFNCPLRSGVVAEDDIATKLED